MKISNSKLVLNSAALLLIIFSFIHTWRQHEYPENLIWSDLEGYYLYLPSVFIYGDFKQEAIRDTGYLKVFPGTDKVYSKYTYGVALMESPFFLVVNALSKPLGYPQNGKSPIYGYTMVFAGLFYFWIGMLFLYKYLRRYFEREPVIVALAGIALGTNLYYYSTFQPGMSHVFSFCLISIFLLLTDTIFIQKYNVLKKPALTWLAYGLIFGMIVLIRPTNLIVALFPLYIWFKKERQPLQFLQNNILYLIIFIVMFVLPFIPQMFYWKYVTDNWVMWSYGEESFSHWKEPKLVRVLFDAWNGWILYSPIVLIPIFALIKGRNSNQYYERVSLLILAIATYIFASWWAWWFGGAFGHRSYVELLTFLAMPFALLMHQIQAHRYVKYSVYIVVVILCYYNIGLTHAYIPPWDGPNWTYESWWNEVKKLF